MHAAPICSQANTRNTTNSTRGYHVAIVRPSVTRRLTGMAHAGKHSTMKDDALHPDLAEGAARGREVVNVQTDLIGHYTLSRGGVDYRIILPFRNICGCFLLSSFVQTKFDVIIFSSNVKTFVISQLLKIEIL